MSNLVFPSLTDFQYAFAYSTFKTPTFATRVQRAVSGRELTVQDYANPIWNFKIQFQILRDFQWVIASEIRRIFDFWLEVGGAYDTFLYDDATDDNVVDQPIGTGDGTTTAFQLVRTFISGGFTEAIIAPNVITNVKLNGTPTSAYTLNTGTGVITFTAAPGSGVAITATFSYYFRCRFMTDSQEFENFLYQRWTTKDLRLKSVVL